MWQWKDLDYFVLFHISPLFYFVEKNNNKLFAMNAHTERKNENRARNNNALWKSHTHGASINGFSFYSLHLMLLCELRNAPISINRSHTRAIVHIFVRMSSRLNFRKKPDEKKCTVKMYRWLVSLLWQSVSTNPFALCLCRRWNRNAGRNMYTHTHTFASNRICCYTLK